MPRLPKEVLENGGGSANKVENFNIPTEKKITFKKKFLIYSFLLVILIELSSIFLVNSKDYLLFIYPLLSQLVPFIILLTLALYSKRLRFCKRKEKSLFILSFYYLFNIVCMFIPMPNYIYSIIVNITLLGVAGYLILTQIENE